MSIDYKNPDLTQHPPRSPRARLGGYVILPRAIDKARATLAGKNGEYHFNCPLDQRFFAFTGIKSEALLEQLKAGLGDGEILDWIKANSAAKPSPEEISKWSLENEHRVPNSEESKKKLESDVKSIAPLRTDITEFFERLDLDDYVTFGGKA